MAFSPARAAALHVLERVIQSERPVQEILDFVLRGGDCSAPDRALATELVYGVFRVQSRLDLILKRFLKSSAKTPLALRLILQIGIYELLYLDRIPPYATVDAAVELAKKKLGRPLSGAANGILRSVIRAIEAEPDAFSVESLEKIGGLSASSGVPDWILDIWKRSGVDVMKYMAEASSRVPWTCVRVHAGLPGAAKLAERLALLPSARRVGAFGILYAPHSRPDDLDDLVKSGRVSLQGAGSLSVLEALGLYEERGSVWDACAGRGGKSFALMERGVNVVVASDVSKRRLNGFFKEAVRLGVSCPCLVRASAAEPPFAADVQFDTVLADVPCSGLGTLSRHPDLRFIRKKEHISGLIELQSKILDAAWTRVKQGGRLAYITCTVNQDENELRIEDFLSRHTNAALSVMYAPKPDDTGADVMFGALLYKR